jgi:hypothetical protein
MVLSNDPIALNILINEIQPSNFLTIYDHTTNPTDWMQTYDLSPESFDLIFFELMIAILCLRDVAFRAVNWPLKHT